MTSKIFSISYKYNTKAYSGEYVGCQCIAFSEFCANNDQNIKSIDGHFDMNETNYKKGPEVMILFRFNSDSFLQTLIPRGTAPMRGAYAKDGGAAELGVKELKMIIVLHVNFTSLFLQIKKPLSFSSHTGVMFLNFL